MQRDPRHHQRRDQRADVRARVEDARGQRALFAGKPFRHGLDGSGKTPCLAQPKRKPRQCKSRRCARDHHDREPRRGIQIQRWQAQSGKPVSRRVGHGGEAPQDHGQGESAPRAHPIHDATGQQQADGVGQLEAENDGGINAFVAPLKFLHQRRFEDADDLAVNVIDGRGEEEKCTNDPAIMAA